MKYSFIRAHQTEFHVRAMSRVLRVHFSGFYVPLGYDVKDRKGAVRRMRINLRRAGCGNVNSGDERIFRAMAA